MSEPAVDQEVGAALATLHVPDHDITFWNELGQRLISEREAPAEPTFDPIERLELVDRRPEPPPPEAVAPVERARFGRRVKIEPEHRRPAVSELADRAGRSERVERVRRRPNWRRRGLIGLLVLGVLGAVAAAVWLGATAEPDPPKITATQVASRMSTNLTRAGYVTGRIAVVREGKGQSYTFVRSTSGSFRLKGLSLMTDTGYDAAAGSARTWSSTKAPDGTTSIPAFEDTGLTGGPPDADGRDRYLAGDDLTRVVQALASSGSTVARETRFAKRKALVLDARLTPTALAPADHLRIVVDQARMLPLQVERSAKGRVLERQTFSGMRTTSTVRPGTFSIGFPAGAQVQATDHGFSAVQLPQVRSLVGYAPMTPSYLPKGYELAQVAIEPTQRFGVPSTAGGTNPPDAGVVSLTYRRGVERITVTTRQTGDPASRWADPFVTPALAKATKSKRVRLEGGRFLGATVEQVSEGPTVSHLWGRTNDYVFTVAGDLNPTQLRRVAESLT